MSKLAVPLMSSRPSPSARWIGPRRRGDQQTISCDHNDDRIAGGALDCFEADAVSPPQRSGELDILLLRAHSIAWTDEMVRYFGRGACQVMVERSLGAKPRAVLTP